MEDAVGEASSNPISQNRMSFDQKADNIDKCTEPMVQRLSLRSLIEQNDNFYQFPQFDTQEELLHRSTLEKNGYKEYLDSLSTPQWRCNRQCSIVAFFSMLFVFSVVVVFVLYEIIFQFVSTDSTLNLRGVCNFYNYKECVNELKKTRVDDVSMAIRIPIHYSFTLGASFVTVVLLSYLSKRRNRVRQRKLNALPKRNVDLWQGSSSSFNRVVRSMVIEGLTVSMATKQLYPRFMDMISKGNNESETAFSNLKCQDKNWGWVKNGEHGEITYINFKTKAVSSFAHIACLASSVEESLVQNSSETAREYMMRLKTVCSDINVKKVDEFICLYEEARYGNSNFDSEKWDRLTEYFDYFDEFFSDYRR